MRVETNFPLALTSADYLNPAGSASNNTTNTQFNQKLYSLYNNKISVLDLGCAGGGFVRECIRDGHFAIGLDGSDYGKKNKKFEWVTIPNNLFLTDISQPFQIYDDNDQFMYFDVITAWEVLEHIAEENVDTMLRNVTNHMWIDSIFIVSINVASEEHAKSIYGTGWGPNLHHQNVKPPLWWDKKFAQFGLEDNKPLRQKHFAGEFVRGPGRGCSGDFTEETLANPKLHIKKQWATINRVLEFWI